jgi:hypothetical protein
MESSQVTLYEDDYFKGSVGIREGELMIHLDIKAWNPQSVRNMRACMSDFLRECNGRGVDMVFALPPDENIRRLGRLVWPPFSEVTLEDGNTLFSWRTDRWVLNN